MTEKYTKALDNLEKQVLSMLSLYQDDLIRMIDAGRNLIVDISKEQVQCRRLRKPTDKYKQLIQRIEEHIETIEGYLIQATLTEL